MDGSLQTPGSPFPSAYQSRQALSSTVQQFCYPSRDQLLSKHAVNRYKHNCDCDISKWRRTGYLSCGLLTSQLQLQERPSSSVVFANTIDNAYARESHYHRRRPNNIAYICQFNNFSLCLCHKQNLLKSEFQQWNGRVTCSAHIVWTVFEERWDWVVCKYFLLWRIRVSYLRLTGRISHTNTDVWTNVPKMGVFRV